MKLWDSGVLVVDDREVPRGTSGVIIDVYDDGAAFEVEWFSGSKTIAVFPVGKDEVAPAKPT